MKNEKGFTLIEIVMVIILLGILAAVAIPRFADLATDARIASVDGMYGAVQGAAAIANAQARIDGVDNGTVTIEGQNVTIVNRYPSDAAGGIDAAIAAFDGYSFVPTTGFQNKDAPTPANCAVNYTDPPALDNRPAIVKATNGC